MLELIKSLPFKDLETKPPLTGRIRITDEMQQALALLVGWDGVSRRLVSVSPSGVLYTASPRIKGILNILADQAAYNWQGDDIPTTEIMVGCNCKNVGDVWVNVGAAAAIDTGFLLEAGDSIVISINNLRSLHLHIVSNGEKAIIAYTI